jgi:SARP family transcriptional regulator, regulator of embCAB operon
VVGPITRIQLCGQFAVVAGSRRIEDDLPGRRGRLLVAYLVAHRDQPTTRDRLIDALWLDASSDAPATLTVLLSKVRALLGHDTIRGRASLQLALPPEALVDTEVALVGLHRAESAIALGQWRRAWANVLGAQFTARRRFLAEYDAPWINAERDRFALIHQRALACYVQACLGIGGTELPAAERAARSLVGIAPLWETGYRLLMQAQAASGDTAEALRTYEQLRGTLADELGVDPDPQTRDLHRRLLTGQRR